MAEETIQGTFTDPRDGKVYKTVKIGEQVWLAENLNYETEGSLCYNNDPANGEKYGRLYTLEQAKKACPLGWHLPDNKEWQTLINFAGGNDVAGKKLKAENGFFALPGGFGNLDGSFGTVGDNGYWWSVDGDNNNPGISNDNDGIGKYPEKRFLYSVRCIKD